MLDLTQLGRGSIVMNALRSAIRPIVPNIVGKPLKVCYASRYINILPTLHIAVKDPTQDALRQLARTKLEQDMEELHVLLDQTRAFVEESETLGKDLQRDIGLKKAISDIEMIDRSIW